MKYFLISLSIGFLFSQETMLHKHPDEFKESSDRLNLKRQRMDNMMIWRLTDKLELTVEQSELFFPQYRKFREDIKKINNEEKKIGDNSGKEEKERRRGEQHREKERKRRGGTNKGKMEENSNMG